MSIRPKRGTRAALNTLAAASGLKVGELLYLTDEQAFVVATAVNAYYVVGSKKADDEQFRRATAYARAFGG